MKKFLITAMAVLMSIAFTGMASAQSKSPTPQERAYQFRTSLFQTFAWKLGQVASAKAKGDEKLFKKHAADLAYLSTMTEEGFQLKNNVPEGSKAKPKIWEDYPLFMKKALAMESAAKALTEKGAMKSFDVRDFGSKNCGGCHREFKVKQ